MGRRSRGCRRPQTSQGPQAGSTEAVGAGAGGRLTCLLPAALEYGKPRRGAGGGRKQSHQWGGARSRVWAEPMSWGEGTRRGSMLVHAESSPQDFLKYHMLRVKTRGASG